MNNTKKNLQSLEYLDWVVVLQELVVGQPVLVGLHPAEQKSRLEVIKFTFLQVLGLLQFHLEQAILRFSL
tara:strand:+ start:23 stop:232 length:210 start_codon:yes stop_codon:yes gene_type:complete